MAGYLGFDATDEKPFIFVSYNTEDQVRLSKIAKELRAHQINIWYDNGIHRISPFTFARQKSFSSSSRRASSRRRTPLSKKSMTCQRATPRKSASSCWMRSTPRSFRPNTIFGGATSATGKASKPPACPRSKSRKRSAKSAAGWVLLYQPRSKSEAPDRSRSTAEVPDRELPDRKLPDRTSSKLPKNHRRRSSSLQPSLYLLCWGCLAIAL